MTFYTLDNLVQFMCDITANTLDIDLVLLNGSLEVVNALYLHLEEHLPELIDRSKVEQVLRDSNLTDANISYFLEQQTDQINKYRQKYQYGEDRTIEYCYEAVNTNDKKIFLHQFVRKVFLTIFCMPCNTYPFDERNNTCYDILACIDYINYAGMEFIYKFFPTKLLTVVSEKNQVDSAIIARSVNASALLAKMGWYIDLQPLNLGHKLLEKYKWSGRNDGFIEMITEMKAKYKSIRMDLIERIINAE